MTLVIGVDPGGTTGICALWITHDPLIVENPINSIEVIQCDGEGRTARIAVIMVVNALIARATLENEREVILSVESFVVGMRAAKSRHSGAGKQARDIIADLYNMRNVWRVSHPAVVVKKWATDERLDKAGIMTATTGMRHARDAGRHALFAAVKGGHMPDPLSRKQTPAL